MDVKHVSSYIYRKILYGSNKSGGFECEIRVHLVYVLEDKNIEVLDVET